MASIVSNDPILFNHQDDFQNICGISALDDDIKNKCAESIFKLGNETIEKLWENIKDGLKKFSSSLENEQNPQEKMRKKVIVASAIANLNYIKTAVARKQAQSNDDPVPQLPVLPSLDFLGD